MTRYGQGAYVGFGEIAGAYTTNGTKSDITHWFRVQSDSDGIQAETDLIELSSLENYEEDINTVKTGQKRVTGTIKIPLTYDQTQNLFRMISQQNKTPVLDPTYGTFYHYDFFLPAEANDPANFVYGSSPHSYCIEVHRGDTGGDSVFYQGCVITSAQFDFQPSSVVTLTMTFVGRGYTVGANSTPSFSSNWMVLTTNQRLRTSPAPAAFLTMNGANYICYGATFTINQPCDERHEVTDEESQAQPFPSDLRRVQIDLDLEAPASDTFWMDIIGNPVKNVIVKQPTLFTSINLEHDAIWGCQEATVRPGIEARPTSPGVVRASVTLDGYADAGLKGYAIGVRNQQSAYR